MDITQYLDHQNPCALILYPLGVNIGRASAIIANRFRFTITPTYVVTWDFENAYQSLEAIGAQDNLKIVAYDKLDDLHHITNSLIVFDDLGTICNLLDLDDSFESNSRGDNSRPTSEKGCAFRHMDRSTYTSCNGGSSGLDGVKILLQRHNTVLIMCTQGVKEVNVVKFSDVIPEARIWNTTFMDLGHNMTYKTHVSQMTPRQDFLYHVRSQEESSQDFSIETEAHGASQEMCNVAFPDRIQNYLDIPASSNMVNLTASQLVSNIGLVEIYSNAPKIENLILCLMSHSNQRHVIFTRYNGVYGLSLIEALINAINRDSAITPKINIATLGRQMSETDQHQQLKNFNANYDAPFILITDILLDDNSTLMNVNHFHLLDGALQIGSHMTHVIYKYRNYPGKPMPPLLTVHNHVCLRADQIDTTGSTVSGAASIDLIYYNQFCEMLRIDIEYWERLVKASPSLISLKDRLTIGI
jgi:hypothetical protein